MSLVCDVIVISGHSVSYMIAQNHASFISHAFLLILKLAVDKLYSLRTMQQIIHIVITHHAAHFYTKIPRYLKSTYFFHI